MQPLKLTIAGDFWDSHIYRGRLYLWDATGALHIFHWNRFIEALAGSAGQPLLYSALAHGDALYRDVLHGSLVRDADILNLVKTKLEDLAEREFTFCLEDLEPFRLGAQDTPFKELHDDLVIFKNTAYALTEKGFFSSTIHAPKRNKYLARRAEKVWSGRGVSLSASRSGLAIAAASDGLFEYVDWRHDEPEQVAQGYATFAHWLFASIYASSSLGHGYLAGYKWVRDIEDSGEWIREFGGILPESDVFESSRREGNGHLTWGSQEKLYKASADRIEVVRFIQKYLWERRSTDPSPFETIGEIPIRNGLQSPGQPISAGVAFFGSIVEYPEGLYVLESDSTLYHIPGAATRWRVFPRSRWYPNHLHVVLEDRLEVLSFNGDLFSDQRSKLAGIEFQEKMLGEI